MILNGRLRINCNDYKMLSNPSSLITNLNVSEKYLPLAEKIIENINSPKTLLGIIENNINAMDLLFKILITLLEMNCELVPTENCN